MSSGGGGGAIVQQTAPWAAMQAGQIGQQAAMAASKAATAQMQEAITAINNSYISQAKTIQPYTQEGLQALNKLNSYLGLSAYNPGNAPEQPTLASEAAKVTSSQVYQWAQDNAMRGSVYQKENGMTNKDAFYNVDPNTGQVIGHISYGDANNYNTPNGADLARLKPWYDQIKNIIASDKVTQDTPQYELDKQNYDFAKSQYDQYQAAGPMTAQQISDDITNQPGYQSQLTQGIDAIQKAGAAQGYLGSGRLLKELNSWGQNTLSTYYGNTLNRLATLASSGQQASTSLMGAAQNQGNAIAALRQSLGDTQANAILAGAQARSNALINANQQFSTVGGSSVGFGGIGQALGGIGSLASAFGFSSKQLKEDFETINTAEILDKVNQLDIEKWKYKGINIDHIGPYAQQFKDTFGVGDGQSINLIDAVGILLASVQELTKKLDNISKEVH